MLNRHMKPYTYLIGWTNLNLFYYGVRFGKYCEPNDLFKTYFTSSKRVKAITLECGSPDIIEIRRTFNSKQKAYAWEQTVLRRMNVLHDSRFLNASIGGTYLAGQPGKPKTYYVAKPMDDPINRAKMAQTRIERGLGYKSAKYLQPQFGDKNPMRNPEVVAKYKQRITGRKRQYKPDGSWFWSYPEKMQSVEEQSTDCETL